MTTLRAARCEFTQLLALLIDEALRQGFEIALGEGMDRKTDKDPTTDHMAGSLHEIGLAQDVALYRDGMYLTQTEDYRSLGEYWEGLDSHCNWGGRFNDGNHFSFSGPDIPGCLTVHGVLRK